MYQTYRIILIISTFLLVPLGAIFVLFGGGIGPTDSVTTLSLISGYTRYISFIIGVVCLIKSWREIKKGSVKSVLLPVTTFILLLIPIIVVIIISNIVIITNID